MVLVVLLLGGFVVVLLLTCILVVLSLASILIVLLLLLRYLIVNGAALVRLVDRLGIVHLIVVVCCVVPALVSLDPDLVVLCVLVCILWNDFNRTGQVAIDTVVLLPGVLDLKILVILRRLVLEWLLLLLLLLL